MLSPRRGVILRIIVGDYIEKAVPVGSQHIAKGHSLGVSPATIRNDMAMLEEEGYLTQPHTSAGRIPSDRGYRYFVEGLMEQDELSPAEQYFIWSQFRHWEGEMEEWSRLAAELLAELVQTLAITTVPRVPVARFKHLELVALQEFLVLLILVLQETKIKQHLLRLEEPSSQEQLSLLAHRLTGTFEGLSTHQIAELAPPTDSPEGPIVRNIVRLMESEESQTLDPLHVEGLRHLLNQPEFASSDRVRSVMDLVDERRALGTAFSTLVQDRGLRVVIGSENPAHEMQELSVVLAQYGLPGELSGTMGLLGPTRMRYARAISTVRYLSQVMTDLITERHT